MSNGGTGGYIGPSNKQLALNAALEGMRTSGLGHDVDAILKAARKIEAYLNGTDEPRTGSGSTQGINPLGNLQGGVHRSNLAGAQLGGTTQ